MSARVQKVCAMLVAAWHRHGAPLERCQVERVLEQRHLAPEECVAVYARLARVGIVFDDADPREDLVDDGRGGAAQAGETHADDVLGGERRHSGVTRLLRPDEEIELGRRMALARRVREQVEPARIQTTPALRDMIERGARAKETMIAAHLRLVAKIAQPFRHRSALEWHDLVQEGTVGLMRAVEKFDATKGCRFATYAAWWIRQSIGRAVTDTGTPIRLPLRIAADVHRFKRAWRLLSRPAPDQAPTLRELAAALDWDPAKTRFIANLAQAEVRSLEEVVGADQRQTLETVLASQEPGPEAVYLQAETRALAAEMLHSLPARHQDILRLRFGFATGEEWTLEQIGEKLGLSAERIRQLQAQALAQLRQTPRAQSLAGREESAPGAREKR